MESQPSSKLRAELQISPKVINDQEPSIVIMDAFKKFDVNGDGIIEKGELAAVLMDCGNDFWTKKSVKSLLKQIDTNGDGCIQFNEFVDWVCNSEKQKPAEQAFEKVVMETKAQPASESDQIMEAFRKFDLNGDGIITRDELANVLLSSPKGSSLWNEASVAALATALDKNGDGEIEYHEFVDWVCNSAKEAPAEEAFHAHINGASADVRAKFEALAQEAMAAISSVTAEHVDELRAASVDGAIHRPKAGVDSVCIAVMYLFAGIDPAVKINFSGRPREETWEGAQKMMKDPGKFWVSLVGLLEKIDDGKVPPQNIAGARGVLDSEFDGKGFSHEKVRWESNTAAQLHTFTLKIIEYYAAVAPEGHAAAADAPAVLVSARVSVGCRTSEALAQSILAAFDSVSTKDVLDLKVMVGSRGGEDQLKICVAMMQLLAGLIDTGVAVDATRKVKDPEKDTKKGVVKFLSKFAGLRDMLKTLPVRVDACKLPSQNVDGARALVNSMGNQFSYDSMKATSLAAAEFCAYVTNVIKYYDGVTAGATPQGKVVLMQKVTGGLFWVNKSSLSVVRQSIPPQIIQRTFVAVMHLKAGLDLGVVVDKYGKVQDTSWTEAEKLLQDPDEFVQHLHTLKEYLDPDKMPSQNMESARAVVKSLGNEFESMTEIRPGDPKEVAFGLYTYIKYATMFYDARAALQ